MAGHVDNDEEFGRGAAAVLAVRGTRRTENGGFQFTRDIRVKEVRESLISDVCMVCYIVLFCCVISKNLFVIANKW